jgi:CheY-like chemotaxis protein
MRLLYVDDDRIHALLFEQACRLVAGIDVDTAGDGAQALRLAQQWLPEALVIDLHLPDTNGVDLLAQLRRLPGLADAPAFLCSADDPAILRRDALAAGFRDCWTKPIDVTALTCELAALRGAA